MSDNMSPTESWNMATATLQRLSRLLDQSSYMAQNQNLTGWFIVILDLRRNLIPFMNDTELKDIKEKIDGLPNNWIVGGKVDLKYFIQVNKTLDEIYIVLYTCMKRCGLLMPKQQDANRAIIDM